MVSMVLENPTRDIPTRDIPTIDIPTRYSHYRYVHDIYSYFVNLVISTIWFVNPPIVMVISTWLFFQSSIVETFLKSQGLSPGVCALSSLARPMVTSRRLAFGIFFCQKMGEIHRDGAKEP